MTRSISLALLVSAALLLVSSPTSACWTRKRSLSPGPGLHHSPVLAVRGCTVHAAWIESSENALLYSRSDDSGATWIESPIRVATGDTLPIVDVRIATTPDRIHFLWQEGVSEAARICHSAIGDAGTPVPRTVLPRTVLSRPGESAEQPTLATAGESLFVAWLRTRRGGDTRPVKIVLRHSQDGGDSWDLPRKVDRRSRGLWGPRLMFSDGWLHLFWGRRLRSEDGLRLDVYHRATETRGESWTPRTTAVRGGWGVWAAAEADQTLHLLWQEAGYKQAFIMYQQSRDRGTTWSASRPIAEGSFASLVTRRDGLEVIAVDDWDGTGPLDWHRSFDGGQSWRRLRHVARWARYPAAIASAAPTAGPDACADRLHVVYGRQSGVTGSAKIFYRRHPR